MPDTKGVVPEIPEQPFRTLAHQLEKSPPCQAGCPNSGDIRSWLGIIAQHKKTGLSLDEACDLAWETLVDRNPLPATLGRICPHPCQERCTRGDKDGAVSIKALERFVGDWGISRKLPLPASSVERQPESIGVVGSGPASLSFAYQMARRGYRVTVYEEHDVPGGMLHHAIPDYRLPREVIDTEVERIFDLGVELNCNIEVGTDIDIDELKERHALIFLGLGAQRARKLKIPGESGAGVISGIDYLQDRKHGDECLRGRRVAVIGGGNTAVDAARSARRDGAEVTILYRRSEKEMPADREEIEDAHKEGVEFRYLVSPVRIARDDGTVTGIEYQRMRLGDPDERGRRRPVPVPGDTDLLAVDTVVVAVAQGPAWHDIGQDASHWLVTAADGRLPGNIWAGGDDVGPGIASRAIAEGRLAAEAAHAELRGLPNPHELPGPGTVAPGAVKADYYKERQPLGHRRRPQEEWLREPDAEIDQTISQGEAYSEALRCMSCGLCFDCQQCYMYCNAGGFARLEDPQTGRYFALALEACEGCGKCIEICPCGYLEAREGSGW